MVLGKKIYRLVGLDGSPHPVWDTTFESIDSAIKTAKNLCRGQREKSDFHEMTVGVEVMTSNGSWRTILYE